MDTSYQTHWETYDGAECGILHDHSANDLSSIHRSLALMLPVLKRCDLEFSDMTSIRECSLLRVQTDHSKNITFSPSTGSSPRLYCDPDLEQPSGIFSDGFGSYYPYFVQVVQAFTAKSKTSELCILTR